MNSKITLSIIIPHLIGKDILYECINSIKSNTNNINYEIIIVNNNCQDNSIKYIMKAFPEVVIVDSSINKGYAGGCNLGAQHANGEYLFFLNNDTIITKNSIYLLIESIKKNNKISSIQPKIKNYFNKNNFDYAGGSGGYIDHLGYPFTRGRIFSSIEKDSGQYDTEEKIFWASGTGFITKKSIFKEVNGFDESLFAHMEEIDYHWKCLLNGYEVYIQPKSIIYHKGGQTLPYGSYKKIYLNHKNSIILFLTNNPKISILKLCKRITLEKIAFLFYLIKLDLKGAVAILHANLWLLCNIKYLILRRRRNKQLIKKYHPISEKLMRPYSVVKKYFYDRKRKFSQLD